MTKELKIPEGLLGAYNNLMRRIPFEYLDDPHIKETILAYLKLGGKKLADHKLESLKKSFSKEFVLRKMQVRNDIHPVKSSSNENEVPAADQVAGSVTDAVADPATNAVADPATNAVADNPELDSQDSDNDSKDVENNAD